MMCLTLKDEKIAQVNDASGGVATGAKYTLSINGKQYQSGQTLNLSDHMTRNQVNDVEAVHTVTKNVNGSNYSATQRQNIRAYLQNYSIVAGYQETGISSNIPGVPNSTEIDDMSISMVKGQATTLSALPTAGTYNYSGAAFTQNETGGKLSYDVNFDTRTGRGIITGIAEAGTIKLDEGNIRPMSHTNTDSDNSTISGAGIQSTATSERAGSGIYKLGFFGPNAEENRRCG